MICVFWLIVKSSVCMYKYRCIMPILLEIHKVVFSKPGSPSEATRSYPDRQAPLNELIDKCVLGEFM